ncbi:MAG: hypothetical protein UT24_C0009G0039 [Candidatus Woesebacteria bacterium GW2011_GWB1_39_12]|uniref:HD domain-containing protein n=2 Tax=Candidatus Woeseibacteriota TaxID=1752722 RepID=A0A0G0PK79_9BACT|nr:MAG: hypothetical protein UT23_C0002G0039 [Candidatus Woesebacteria bacterium GW2011_GWA1_39_12]KKR00722.1 MAG: hypothetical protein UT24_C0009G0039 [Candidatus Woesebacteria bacterium GW2011_GWB1_39_12]
MDHLIDKLRAKVTKASFNPDFIHHKWFVKYHLNIVEQIALELCDIYKNANRNLVKTLIWIHDYGKILGIRDGVEKITEVTAKLMEEIGFEQEFTDKAIQYLRIFESKMEFELTKAPIEVQITSSADAASHMVGPFYSLWWLESPHKTFEELMEDNKGKALKDWNRKIVLPEVKKAFENRNRFVMENSGDFPEKYLT